MSTRSDAVPLTTWHFVYVMVSAHLQKLYVLRTVSGCYLFGTQIITADDSVESSLVIS